MKKKLPEQQKDAFRKHFIAAAEKLFASCGVAGVTMRQIAQAWATARPRHTAISRTRTKSSQRCARLRCIVSATGSMPHAGIATRAPMRKPSEPPTHNPEGVFEMKGLNGQHIHVNPAAGVVIVKLSSHPVGDTAFTHVLDQQAFQSIEQAVRK